MTPVSAAPAVPDRAVPWPELRARARAAVPDVCVVALLGWWAAWLTWGTGGREPRLLSAGCALLALAVAATRPWRAVPLWGQLLVHLVGLAGWLVVAVAPTGTAGMDDAAAYTFAAELGLVLLAWARDAARRLVVLAAVIGAAAAQFAMGWLPWWGMQDTLRLFQGTFYWHNQAGIFLAAGAVMGLGAVAAGRPISALGWTMTPFCVAGTVFTTSRGSEIALALGVLTLVVLLRARRVQLLGAVALSAFVTWALTGPPFFPDRISPTAGTEARSASLVGNGVERLDDWRRAWDIFRHWPLTGAGFNSFDSATTVATDGRDRAGTAFAHNGFLQLFADGGLVLALPVLALLAVVAWRAAVGVPPILQQHDAVRASAVATFAILCLHSGMDFDWAYPSLLALLAVVGVLAMPPLATDDVVPAAGSRGRHVVVATLPRLAPFVLLAGAVLGGWDGGLSLSASVS